MRLAVGLGAAVIVLSLLSVAAVFGDGWRGLLPRGEVAEVPEEPVPDVSREDAIEALSAVLAADKARVRRELARIVAADRELKELRGLHRQLAGYYVREVDR